MKENSAFVRNDKLVLSLSKCRVFGRGLILHIISIEILHIVSIKTGKTTSVNL